MPAELRLAQPTLLVAGGVARLERDGFDPIVYEPPELLSYDLFDASADLGDVIEQILLALFVETRAA